MRKKKRVKNGVAKALAHPMFHQRIKPNNKRKVKKEGEKCPS